jgi:hypothetical protein
MAPSIANEVRAICSYLVYLVTSQSLQINNIRYLIWYKGSPRKSLDCTQQRAKTKSSPIREAIFEAAIEVADGTSRD